jgi:JmjC domain, hydroxylase
MMGHSQEIHPDFFGKAVSKLMNGETAIGISTSYTYFGAATSIFCPHVENGCLNSINLLVDGAPKVWLVCAPEDSSKVEALLARKLGKKCHHLALKRVLLSPQELNDAGVKFYKVGSAFKYFLVMESI